MVTAPLYHVLRIAPPFPPTLCGPWPYWEAMRRASDARKRWPDETFEVVEATEGHQDG